jgi:CelD/BcsL family acetyltransferase involved in cellulose biosynthesis
MSRKLRWTLHPAARFADFAADWAALAREAAMLPALAPELVAPLLACFGDPRALLACCRDGTGDGAPPVAMGVFIPAGRGWSTLQPPQAPLGLWLQQPGQDTGALLHGLLRALPGWPAVVGLTQLDPDLVPRPPDAGSVRTLDYIETARVTLQGDFDDYWQARGKNLRANLKKQRARLAKDGIALRLEAVRDPAAMEAAVADYARLEAAGWKAGSGTAVAPGDVQSRFYAAMLAAFAQRGSACAWRYWYGEQLAAMDLCIEDEGCLIVLKTTYDEAVAGGTSPALLMREESTRAVFEAGRYRRIEFYGRVMEWHLRWTQEIRRLYHVNYYRWPLLARAHAALRARA